MADRLPDSTLAALKQLRAAVSIENRARGVSLREVSESLREAIRAADAALASRGGTEPTEDTLAELLTDAFNALGDVGPQPDRPDITHLLDTIDEALELYAASRGGSAENKETNDG